MVVDATGEIYGDVPNIAARAQALAEPGSVVVTARVQRQVAGLFVAEERGSHELKGVPEPVTLYRIVRASGGGRRSGQRHLTPLVGRDEEMAMLMRRWERARQGDGQLVLIVGEPGLGKSRLLEEFHGRLRETPHTWAEWSFSAAPTKHAAASDRRMGPPAVRRRRRSCGAASGRPRELAGSGQTRPGGKCPIARAATRHPAAAGPRADTDGRGVAAPAIGGADRLVMAGARIQPVVLALEDLHWADPTTLDLLRGIAERGALAPLLVVATTRPEFRPPWGMRSHHVTISLAPLDRAAGARNGGGALGPPRLAEGGGGGRRRAHRRRAAVRRGGDAASFGARRAGRHPDNSADAATITDGAARSARSRARGGADRRGDRPRISPIRCCATSAGMEDAALQAALEKLAEADIVLVQGLPPESDYRFKHALIQDAAYENLLKSRRQVLHRRVAEILRDRLPTPAAAEPEVLAHHFTQAGMTDAAIEWWGKAGDQALRRSAFQEAISHLGKAIEMADRVEKAHASSGDHHLHQSAIG